MSKSGLEEGERCRIRFELGMDYLRAGLFDRAEEVFTGLLAMPAQREAAAAQLLDIYQQEKDWPKAIDCLRAMGGKGRRGETLAQFYCEMAQAQRAAGHAREAASCIDVALSHEANCVRASLLAVDLAVDRGDFPQAYRCLKRVEEQNPRYLPEILPWFLAYGDQLAERRELLDYLDWLGAKYKSAEAAVAMASLIARGEGLDKAADYLSATVASRPSLRGLHALLGLLCEQPAATPHLFVVRQSLQHFVVNSHNYLCAHCGFGSETLYWRCPACLHWETMRIRNDGVGG
ncbi:hypothetical protein [Methylogaea oryzae]|uniref:LapB rubredoxin metal binding domain-containing protein n=1 Tax=Methylogaea oryzae TaxID=1295382 RepID=A0A8D5AIT0_9GAMM|nr:hypothetical protein [Methylogaea oryzae]BBL71681.1 hypothetical protein MoryE10_22870 [Methylogaea oryzae]